MGLITELIFRSFLAHFVGLNTRYFVLKVFGFKKSKQYLTGSTSNSTNSFSQNVLNAIVGIVVISLASILIAWLVYS